MRDTSSMTPMPPGAGAGVRPGASADDRTRRRIRPWDIGRARRRAMALAAYAVALVAFTTYVLLDAFVIPRAYVTVTQPVASGAATEMQTETDATSSAAPSRHGASHHGARPTAGRGGKGSLNGADTSTDVDGSGSGDADSGLVGANDTTYVSGTTRAALTTMRYEDTTVYVVDIVTNDENALACALANDVYGKNVTAPTSEIAAAHGAIVAVNGDYYGARNAGYVVRNGVLYRDVPASDAQEDLVIWSDGSFEVVSEGEASAQELCDAGAWQVFSFGPGLVVDGTVCVGENDEVGRAMVSNPRTAIGQVGEGHYVLVVSDGRTSESEGLTLAELATFMADELNAECAYNLDGGGSSTLWFNGSVVNRPTTTGSSISERSVSDIVYLAL